MYERFYQLRERPFALTPDPDYLYPSRVHQEALGYLRYGIEGHAGFVVITGEIGSGKTTLLQTLLRGLDRETTVARLVNTMLEPDELLEAILIDFGVEPQGRKPILVRQLADFLVAQRAAGRLVLLVVDEAQNLSFAALEEVRMLSNLETEKSKLVQIVLVGQPDLREKLAQPGLEQLRQRVTVSYHLGPLDADDTAAYVNHRLRRASIGAPLEFPRNVTDLVHQRTGGIPRLINVLCDAILLFGYGADRTSIDLDIAREAIAELEDTGVIAPELNGDSSWVQPAPQARSGQDAATAPSRAPSAPGSRAAAALAAAEDSARENMLRAREHQVQRREQEIAEQQRVLLEQARLLREVRVDVARAGDRRLDARAAASWPPIAPRPAVIGVPPMAHVAPAAFSDGEPREGLWQRVRRAFAGDLAPTLGRRS
jgi:putative secretion ATPase (PEP-CTERM system associated)